MLKCYWDFFWLNDINIIYNVQKTFLFEFFLYVSQTKCWNLTEKLNFSIYWQISKKSLAHKPHPFFITIINNCWDYLFCTRNFASWKSLLKPLDIASFALQIIYFGYEKVPLWTTPISKVKKVLNILIKNSIVFQKLIFLKSHWI